MSTKVHEVLPKSVLKRSPVEASQLSGARLSVAQFVYIEPLESPVEESMNESVGRVRKRVGKQEQDIKTVQILHFLTDIKEKWQWARCFGKETCVEKFTKIKCHREIF